MRGMVARCVFRIWPARAILNASRAAASANARIDSNAPPTDRSFRQRGLHRKICHLAPPSDAVRNEGASKQVDGDERGAKGRNG